MEFVMIMEFSSKLLKTGTKLKFLIIGWEKETHGKLKELMFSIGLNFMAKRKKWLIQREKKKSFGKIMSLS